MSDSRLFSVPHLCQGVTKQWKCCIALIARNGCKITFDSNSFEIPLLKRQLSWPYRNKFKASLTVTVLKKRF